MLAKHCVISNKFQILTIYMRSLHVLLGENFKKLSSKLLHDIYPAIINHINKY
ncbi:hypothetical protein HanRHA438_Chr08g0350331 [Helianthus annuus]|nr:hypothetical protein HanRHA438_Chr08g0350331 [Helianthus annuus]